ncbi:uncharacterized protein LOC135472151 [Liolophura sinensis]|uniref:uncharacterized protein LOC135472151 n=1 Tax=Liolophura sinensis TaxID=3198878 RepID=UPI003158BF81
MYLFLCVCVLSMATSTALQPRLPCAAQLFGCGLDVGFDFQNDCCECIEFFPTDESLSIDILCAALEDTPSCCPCAQTTLSAILSAGSHSSGSHSTGSHSSGSASLGYPQDKLDELVEAFEGLRIVFRVANNGKNAGKPLPAELERERTKLVNKGLKLIEILEHEC